MVHILREADNVPVAEAAKKYGVSEQTIYGWAKRYAELGTAEVKRLRQLERENAPLKELVAEQDLELEAMKEIGRKKWRTHVRGGDRWVMCLVRATRTEVVACEHMDTLQ